MRTLRDLIQDATQRGYYRLIVIGDKVLGGKDSSAIRTTYAKGFASGLNGITLPMVHETDCTLERCGDAMYEKYRIELALNRTDTLFTGVVIDEHDVMIVALDVPKATVARAQRSVECRDRCEFVLKDPITRSHFLSYVRLDDTDLFQMPAWFDWQSYMRTLGYSCVVTGTDATPSYILTEMYRAENP
jgi:hypothetical protein